MSRGTRQSCTRFLIPALAIALFVSPAVGVAQMQPEEQLFTVIQLEIKHDMMPEFERLQKELNAALEKVGVTDRRVSQTVRGPSSEYYIVSPVDSWAEYDEPDSIAKALGEAGAASWVAQVTKCIQSRRVDTYRLRGDLSIPLQEGRTPGLFILTTRRNLPGRYGDYNDWMKNKWVPAAKAAGMNGYFVYHNAMGGSAREWAVVSVIDGWSVLDEPHPVEQHLGEEGFRSLTAGRGAMTTAPERKVLRIRPDLSIMPGTGSSTSDNP